jgi:hypothetical protein
LIRSIERSEKRTNVSPRYVIFSQKDGNAESPLLMFRNNYSCNDTYISAPKKSTTYAIINNEIVVNIVKCLKTGNWVLTSLIDCASIS